MGTTKAKDLVLQTTSLVSEDMSTTIQKTGICMKDNTKMVRWTDMAESYTQMGRFSKAFSKMESSLPEQSLKWSYWKCTLKSQITKKSKVCGKIKESLILSNTSILVKLLIMRR